jgi:hypothetical protein
MEDRHEDTCPVIAYSHTIRTRAKQSELNSNTKIGAVTRRFDPKPFLDEEVREAPERPWQSNHRAAPERAVVVLPVMLEVADTVLGRSTAGD